ncbi:gas vesicle protein GvpO, partial [Kitasatospora sp. NPDC057198]|uniref:gas vesicle protein GvpO n=1 Tax=Kitasatospora sp. NPDC057198 TaxID=3346046 RepID=UPI00362642DE
RDDRDDRDGDRDGEERAERRSRAGRAGIGAAEAAGRAAAQVRAMTGRSPEGVTSLERTEEGWRIGVEVVESRRIPDSTDILAVYRVDLDRDGELLAYRRENRYHRGRTPDEEGET